MSGHHSLKRTVNNYTYKKIADFDGRFYISVEYLSGGTLADRLKKSGPLTPQRTAEFVRQVASALDYAHQKKTIHRDVKPANILIRSDPKGGEQAILADFGIAKAMQESSNRQSTAIIGTPSYLSPEQILRPGNIDERSDIYALGVVAYQLLTGEIPFKAAADESFIQLASLIENIAPPSLVDREPGFHPEIERAIFKALEKEPDDRYESAGAFANTLDNAVHTWQQESGEEKQAVVLSGMAVQAMGERHWDDAVKYWKQYLALVPEGGTVVVNGLLEAEKQIEIRKLRTQAQQCEAKKEWPEAIVALTALLAILPDDQPVQQQLSRAHTQQELQVLYAQVISALDEKQWDDAIELSQQIEKQSPDYQDIQRLRDEATSKKTDKLKEAALVAVGQREGELALSLVQQIRATDPTYQFCPKAKVEQIIQMADQLQREVREKQEAEERDKKKKLFLIIGAVILLLLMVCIGGGLVLRGRVDGESEAAASLITIDPSKTNTPVSVSTNTPSPTRTPTVKPAATTAATSTKKPTAVSTATDMPTSTPTATKLPTQTPAPTATDIPQLTRSTTGPATIYEGPGTNYARTGNIPKGTEVVILNKNRANASWYLVDTGNLLGWVSKNYLEEVPNGTSPPVATSSATPVEDDDPEPPTVTTESPITTDGPLRITANWGTGNEHCVAGGGFEVDYWMNAEGGNGLYTYQLGDVVVGQNIAGGMTYHIGTTNGDYSSTLTVSSGGQTIAEAIYVNRSDWCNN